MMSRKQFSTSLEESLIKRAKLEAVEKDTNINNVIENALTLMYRYQDLLKIIEEKTSCDIKTDYMWAFCELKNTGIY